MVVVSRGLSPARVFAVVEHALIVISPSPDCKILSIPYTRNASRPSPSVPSLSVASQRDRRAKKSTRASRAPLVPEMTSTSSPRSSPPRCSRAAPRFHERDTFSLVPARVVPVSPRPVRASSSSSSSIARAWMDDGSRVVVVVVVVVARSLARASSSLASRSRAHLDDDERSPELIERETHRARPIVADSRATSRIHPERGRRRREDPPRSSVSSTIHRRDYARARRTRPRDEGKAPWGTVPTVF